MANEHGQIVAVESDTVWVKCQTQSACQSCSAKGSCGTSVLAKAFPTRTQSLGVKVERQHGFQVGQTVELTVTDKVLVNAAIKVYLIPLLGLILGAAVLPYLVTPEWAELSSVIGGGVGLATGLFLTNACFNQASSHHQVSIKPESHSDPNP